MIDSILTDEELRTPTWRKLKAHINDELALLRKELESDQKPERTAKVRGQIRSYVLLLALELPAPAFEEADNPEA